MHDGYRSQLLGLADVACIAAHQLLIAADQFCVNTQSLAETGTWQSLQARV